MLVYYSPFLAQCHFSLDLTFQYILSLWYTFGNDNISFCGKTIVAKKELISIEFFHIIHARRPCLIWDHSNIFRLLVN